MRTDIKANGPAYRGAPMPEFDPMQINESKMNDNERFKAFNAWLDGDGGHVEWLTQGSEKPSDDFNNEIVRAFKANGIEAGSKINIKYGIRDYGLTENYDITVS